MSDRDSSPEGNEFTKNLKSSKGKKPKPEQKDLEEAVPAHILRFIQNAFVERYQGTLNVYLELCKVLKKEGN